MDPIEIIKRSVRERHLEQLSRLELVVNPLERSPIFADFNDLQQWTIASKAQINAGIANRVYGGPFGAPINFNNAFMAFMESAAMYLRNSDQVVEASILYRSNATRETAFQRLEQSTAQIDQLAEMWGMKFIQICDFVEIHPDGHRFLVGPFCGAFFPIDIAGGNPFIGVAFKGTSMPTWEWINDLLAMFTIRPDGRLWETEVSSGFYYPLFSSYKSDPTQVPFLLIQSAVQEIATQATMPVITHVTGHSLGGAYSSLTYAQLTISGYGTPIASLGDLYTFGSPRTGRDHFAERVRDAVPTSLGSSWRIANYKDPVPTLPALPPWKFWGDPFIHIDAGFTIFSDAVPAAIPTEIGTRPTWKIITTLSPHYTTEYYRSLTFATAGAAPVLNFLGWGKYPLPVSPIDPANILADANFDLNFVEPQISLQNVKGCVVGRIQNNLFCGEITAVGMVQPLAGIAAFNYRVGALKTLYSKENQCIFGLADAATLRIDFFVDGVHWAWATVAQAAGLTIDNIALTRGTCVWTFTDQDNILENFADEIGAKTQAFSDQLLN